MPYSIYVSSAYIFSLLNSSHRIWETPVCRRYLVWKALYTWCVNYYYNSLEKIHSLEQAFVKGFTVELCVSLAPTDPCWNRLSLPVSHTVMSAWICWYHYSYECGYEYGSARVENCSSSRQTYVASAWHWPSAIFAWACIRISTTLDNRGSAMATNI